MYAFLVAIQEKQEIKEFFWAEAKEI